VPNAIAFLGAFSSLGTVSADETPNFGKASREVYAYFIEIPTSSWHYEIRETLRVLVGSDFAPKARLGDFIMLDQTVPISRGVVEPSLSEPSESLEITLVR
jgi:hypothetical protein